MSGVRLVRAIVAASALAASGCIVAEPPPYEPPPRTPPIFDLFGATPSIGQVIPVSVEGSLNEEYPTRIEFSVPLRSEDRDEELWYALFLDYTGVSPNKPLKDGPIAASTFDDLSRDIRIPWIVPNISNGCHQLTLLAMHRSSWNFEDDRPYVTAATGDLARATWWIHVNPVRGEEHILRNCLTLGQDPGIER